MSIEDRAHLQGGQLIWSRLRVTCKEGTQLAKCAGQRGKLGRACWCPGADNKKRHQCL